MIRKLTGLALAAVAAVTMMGTPAQANDDTRSLDAIAHRGYDGYHRENSLVGFQVVLRNGVEAVETDVRFTRDGYAILAHDDWVWSSRCDRFKGRKWKDLTWAQVRTIKCDRFPIATLGEVARLVSSYDATIYVEPKAGRTADILNVLQRTMPRGRYVIESFNTSDLDLAEARGADTLYLYGGRASVALSTALSRDYDGIGPNTNNDDPATLAAAEDHGIEVVVWTPNGAAALEDTCEAGATGAFTDTWRAATTVRC